MNYCCICGRPLGEVGPEFKRAQVSHLACAMEQSFAARGESPAGCHVYQAALVSRAAQIGGRNARKRRDDKCK